MWNYLYGRKRTQSTKRANKHRKREWLLSITEGLLWQACKYTSGGFRGADDQLALRIARHTLREHARRKQYKTARSVYPLQVCYRGVGNPFYTWHYQDHDKSASASNFGKYARKELSFIRSLRADHIYATRQYHAIERLRRRLLQKATEIMKTETVQRNINDLVREERNRQIAELKPTDWDAVARVGHYETPVYLGQEPIAIKATLRLLTVLGLTELVSSINGLRYYRPTAEAHHRLHVMGRPLKVPGNSQPMPRIV